MSALTLRMKVLGFHGWGQEIQSTRWTILTDLMTKSGRQCRFAA